MMVLPPMPVHIKALGMLHMTLAVATGSLPGEAVKIGAEAIVEDGKRHGLTADLEDTVRAIAMATLLEEMIDAMGAALAEEAEEVANV